MTDPEPSLVNVGEAAERAKVSVRTIGQWIRDGLLVAIPNGPERLVRVDELDALRRARYQRKSGRLPRRTRGDAPGT